MADQVLARELTLSWINSSCASGVEWIFGNPGTTEQQLLRRMPDHPQLGFVVALHESVAVAAADGYARASGKVGVVELHAATPALATAWACSTTPAEGRTPLLVSMSARAEQAGLYLEPTLSGDFVAQVHPLAKWAVEVRTANEIPQIVRRAIKVATTEPCGPVVVAVPLDLMSASCTAAIAAPSLIDSRVTPSDGRRRRVRCAMAAAQRLRRSWSATASRSRGRALTEVGDLAQLLPAALIYGGVHVPDVTVEPG